MTNISACSNKIKRIEAVFKSLETEFQTYIQDQSIKDIPVLKSSVCSNKPMMEVDDITDLSNIILKCQDNIDSLFNQHFDINSMSRIIGQVVKEMADIRASMDRFQQVEFLEQCMKVLKKTLYDANLLCNQEKSIISKKQRVDSHDDHQTRNKRPQSPLSPMVNPKEYAPLTKKKQVKR